MTVRKVLCADESSADLAALGKILRGLNINVVYAISGIEAIHYAKTELPDLIFLDIVMPIPETSRTSAIQVAATLQRPYIEGFVKNRYIARTFIMPVSTYFHISYIC